MRNYQYIDQYLDILIGDIYPQPPDKKHLTWCWEVISGWIAELGCNTVLDVGCGYGFAQPMFEDLGIAYTGVCLGTDYDEAKELGRNVYLQDFNFLEFPENSFDLVFARHSLEHSPMPLLTLFEWHRVAKKWLCLVMPHPLDSSGYIGRNHYSVEDKAQIKWLLRCSGWKVLKTKYTNEELRFLSEKLPRVSPEGYVKELSGDVLSFDRTD